ncbi:hypothetical protein B0H16DRAFT_1463621 [Mycena metata]|uniref:Uncharacterized protein n=1 Tax=Mycena metata TaxID=1033252 RepID=A0AAD7N369_9AGAR|nr:hypothetical protein B0H16DRAFT_1463621 [Mycena metata]
MCDMQDIYESIPGSLTAALNSRVPSPHAGSSPIFNLKSNTEVTGVKGVPKNPLLDGPVAETLRWCNTPVWSILVDEACEAQLCGLLKPARSLIHTFACIRAMEKAKNRNMQKSGLANSRGYPGRESGNNRTQTVYYNEKKIVQCAFGFNSHRGTSWRPRGTGASKTQPPPRHVVSFNHNLQSNYRKRKPTLLWDEHE